MAYSKILVTGGAGFTGSHLVDKLLDEDFEVTVLDDLSTGTLENLSSHIRGGNFHFVKGDVCNSEIVGQVVEDVDAVFHEAAIASVPRSLEDPVFTDHVNVDGTLNLLSASLNSHVKRFVYASSCAVYGDSGTLPHNEQLPLSPLSPYAASKVSAESYCKAFYKAYGLETVSLRLFNVYGPRQSSGAYGGVIEQFLDRLLKGEEPVIFGDGGQTRDLVHVGDVVEAHMLALEKKGAVGEVLNIASGVATSINKLAQMLTNMVGGRELKPIYSSPRRGDVRHSQGDIAKAENLLGYAPKIFLEEGLRKYVELRKTCSSQLKSQEML